MKGAGSGAAADGGAVYTLGIFGAWVYFWQQADGIWEMVLSAGSDAVERQGEQPRAPSG